MAKAKEKVSRRRFLAGLIALGAAAAGCAPGVPSRPTTGPSSPEPARPTPASLPPSATPEPAAAAAAVPKVPAAGKAVPATATTGPAKATTIPDLIAVKSDSPAAATRAAIEELGGIGRFVQRGQAVVIKPNICASRAPQYAATTNPEVVATLVSLCLEAGAAKVLVMDGPFSGVSTAYAESGIEAAVQKAGGTIQRMAPVRYKRTPIPHGRDLKEWPIYEDVLKADVLINVPIAKHHNLAGLTLGMKNLMGAVLSREQLHGNLGQRLADLTSAIKPTLTVVDAVRILTRNGPTGGSLADVKQLNTVIACTDPVASDAYAATLFGRKGTDLDYVRAGDAMGLGTMDLTRLRIGERAL